ncbi:hypothetical protein BTZ20_3278 [Rhodococcus sp. MTM3W5.2]|nr:hypothetical protein BTZ20_3278 [Rhodococcus sp. MTM3W5.2]
MRAPCVRLPNPMGGPHRPTNIEYCVTKVIPQVRDTLAESVS